MYDLVLRNGRIIDGTGTPEFVGDVGVNGSMISAVGRLTDSGTKEVDAGGLIITPGFVDVHTHYDGQALWDADLAPSSWHGVTTAVFGNCGVGFAPVRPNGADALIELMEGVEDIPGSVLSEGVDFQWESFAEYLDALDARPRSIDIAAQVPHSAVRMFAMGERGADHRERPTADEIAVMAQSVADGLMAGALGFTTSRTYIHKTLRGQAIPTLTASSDELLAIADAMGTVGRGVLQAVSDIVEPGLVDIEAEFALLRSLVERSGRPMSLLITQVHDAPDHWRTVMGLMEQAAAEGAPMRAQVAPRAPGILCGLQATSNPFGSKPSYREIEHLSLDERVREMLRPERRAAILGEELGSHQMSRRLHDSMDQLFELGETPDYEPPRGSSVAAQAERLGISAQELAYDMMLRRDGRELLYFPLRNFASGNLDVVAEMLRHPLSVPGLSDGGAHAGAVCDASFPTYLLYHWGRDRSEGRIALERLVQMQTADSAALVGLNDRGLVRPGYRADLNVIDFEKLNLRPPRIVHDLPAGGRRLVQEAVGYRHTFCAGVETFTDGKSTGAYPGRLQRGARSNGLEL